MKIRNNRRLFTCFMAISVLALSIVPGIIMRNAVIGIRQSQAEYNLHFVCDNILLQLQERLNEADNLAEIAFLMGNGDGEWFAKAAAPLLEKEGMRFVCLIEGDTVKEALPDGKYGGLAGKNIKDFSYIYTLGKVTKELVVEGPVFLDYDAAGQKVFIFLKPITKDGAYQGEVAVALDSEYVLTQLGLDDLYQNGYDYELWRVNPEDGGKEVVAASGKGVDFSHAAKTDFYIPSQWNISIQPAGGWVGPAFRIGIIAGCCLIAIVLFLLVWSIARVIAQSLRIRRLNYIDSLTGLCNLKGFTEELNRWLSDEEPVFLFYLVFEGYNQVSQLIGPQEEEALLKDIPQRLRDFIKSPYLAGRLGAGIFAVAVREDMDEAQCEDFSRGMSLELLLKIRLNGEKSFLSARYQYARCQAGPGKAEEEIASLINAYYMRLTAESPVAALTEKCRQLINGQSNVVFDEYTDFELMELSKTFNQYRKQVEQLAYSDPMFQVGNRPKYVRDVNMLISYDKKRRFNLFCIDIIAFSQFNELFSVEFGDKILQEVLNRLSRTFGTYLYRINGDVFLGISLTGEYQESFAQRLERQLTEPATVGNASFALQVRIVACRYPAHGDSPEALLDRIQSALRFAKESDQRTIIYDDKLDEMVRTEAEILHRLNLGIAEQTLEVWYQPQMFLKTKQYLSAEALVRLPDGRGGYFPAGQVISIAERSGMVERLGDYVLARACSYMKENGKRLGLLHMGINLSVQQLLLENSADHLLQIIRSTGVDTGKITLEITESVLIQSLERVSAVLGKLRETGIHIALDDFGVGYSSLNYLSNLPVDVIKIDRSLTQQILTNPRQHALLRSIVEMAQINSLTVVSEGVETAEEQETISESGVHYIQGFYYSRPLSGKGLLQFLDNYQGLSVKLYDY